MKTESTIFLLTCFAIQVHCKLNQSLEGFTFLCHDYEKLTNQYIDETQFCNNKNDCPDGEDEHLGCKRDKDHFCGEGKFWCDNQCKHNITVRCNTINECKDGTDEEDCGDEIDVRHCTSADKFLCKDGLRCLRIDYTCDGSCNCFDCSDEDENCLKTDYDLMAKCPNGYFDTVNGPECFCDPNKAGFKKLCRDIKPCGGDLAQHIAAEDSLVVCHQRCIKFRSKRQCTCFDDYYPLNETYGGQCVTKQNVFVYYTDGNIIKMLNKSSLMTSTILSQIANCTLLSATNDYIYYTTFSGDKGSIFKKSLNKDEKPERLIETDFAITSIAVDFITNNVYFTSKGSLSVCTSSGSVCTQLKCCNITSVALAPKHGLMFYIKREEEVKDVHLEGSILMKSNMDGSDENLPEPTGSTYDGEIIFFHVDESEHIIYMLEKNDKVAKSYEMKFSSGFRDLNEWSGMRSSDIQRMSIFDRTVFFTRSSDNNSIYFQSSAGMFHIRTDRSQKLSAHTNESTTSSITDLYSYAPTQLNDENPCDSNKSSCSGLCLLKPNKNETSAEFSLSHSCFCDGFAPTNNNRWCSNDRIKLIHSEPTNQSNPSMFPWVLVGILILIILATSAIYVFRKYKLFEYHLTWRHKRQPQRECEQLVAFCKRDE